MYVHMYKLVWFATPGGVDKSAIAFWSWVVNPNIHTYVCTKFHTYLYGRRHIICIDLYRIVALAYVQKFSIEINFVHTDTRADSMMDTNPIYPSHFGKRV